MFQSSMLPGMGEPVPLMEGQPHKGIRFVRLPQEDVCMALHRHRIESLYL